MRDISHLDQRILEARLIGRLYSQMLKVMDADTAQQVVTQTLIEAAQQEGRLFASGATPEASLQHFKSIRDLWGEALEVEVVEDEESVFRFNVIRCKYVEAYSDLGLPPELVRILSCTRDAPFARGYSARLDFTRTGTLADGAAVCDFCYRWAV